MDVIIPAMILAGFAALIIYSSIKECRRINRKREKQEERRKFSHPPMDLRMKDDPHETKRE